MFFLFDLIFLSLSNQCRHHVFPRLGQPNNETLYVDEGEHICINSTGNYLNVLFHNSLLSVRYFTSPKSTTIESKSINDNVQSPLNKNLVEVGKFEFPAEKGGVSFSKNVYGSVDILALVPGNVTISTFVFPNECTYGCYVSTESSLDLHVADVFGSFPGDSNNQGKTDQSFCVWYPENEYNLQTSVVPSQDNQIMVCQSQASCETPISRTQQFAEISGNKFIKVIPADKDFWSSLNLLLHTDNPSNFFQISGSIKKDDTAVPLALSIKKLEDHEEKEDDEKEQINPKDNENDDDGKENINDKANDQDDEVNRALNNNHDSDNLKKSNKHHHKRGRRSNSDSYSTLVVILTAFVCIFLIICVAVYLFSQNGPCSKHRSLANDHSEERLLPNGQQGFFPGFAVPWGQHPPGQGFFTGVFPAFAPTPGQPQSSQQQMQYLISPGSSFQTVPNSHPQDNQNNEKDDNNTNQQPQMQFQQPVVYMVPPQYQQQFLQQQQQYMQQFQQNQPPQQQNQLSQQQNQPSQQNKEN